MADTMDPYDQAADDFANGRRTDNVRPIIPLLAKPARLPDPATIPPRPWLLGTQLLRGFVTVLVAPGGTGKTIYGMTAALSLAVGTPLLGIKVWQRVNAWCINEDPMEELERRLAAIMIRHQVADEHVCGKFFLNSMDERGLCMATRGPDGFTVVHPDEEALIAQIRQNNIGLLDVDPFAESHSLEENSNPDMIKAAAGWRRVARVTGCAIKLAHHVRKGASEGIDGARGAKGLTDSARVGLLMSTMTEAEAEKLGVTTEERFKYVRVDDAKVNLTPRIDRATWFKLDTVKLENGSDIYPNGDNVAAMVPWEPPKVFSAITNDQISEALDIIAAGPEPGVLFSGTRRGGTDRWAGNVLCRIAEITEAQAQAMLDSWHKSGLVFTKTFHHPSSRRDQKGLGVDFSKRPT